jgi:acyl transferase domain-containing protein
LSVAAGRLAYSLGLQGPCMAVDTACSSSLVAIHLACKSLRDRECRVALAGGVNLMLTPEPTITGCRMHMLAPDGRCKTFDASADGYVRGEGAGVVVLKRLSDAVADGDRVLAVIRGTAVNQDGRSSGLTVPNGTSQQAVIREALANAGVDPHAVEYVEAHGTGTALGDPIEVEALRRVLAEGRSPDRPLVVGSVKTNIGHLEAAAGVAGLIKVILAMRHGEIPSHLHFKALNPHISLEGTPLTIASERTAWPSDNGGRIAGVSSFGFSGTNAHVIVGDAPPAQDAVPGAVERPRHLLTLSAKSEEALRGLAARYAGLLENADGDASFADICHAAAVGRSHFAHRLAIPAASGSDARAALIASASGASAEVVSGVAPPRPPAVAFLFPGQGAQYAAMGRGLFETQPVFRAAIEECDALLKGAGESSIVTLLYGSDGSDVDETGATQPLLFAVEYALAALWQSWGIRPSVMLGHSLGEYVAACVAGVFPLADALALIAARGRVMQATAEGSMAAVIAGEDVVRGVVERHGGRVAIAAINGPANVVISGAPADVAAAAADLTGAGVAVRMLRVRRAFHSALMDPILDEFERAARRVSYSAPRIPIVSSVTGAVASPAELMDPVYWRRQVREAVRFADGLQTLNGRGAKVFLEIGPGSTLTALGRTSAAEPGAAWLTSIRKDRDDWQEMLSSVASLYVHGVEIDWAAFDAPYARRKVVLPAYPFQRERYWLEQPTDARAPRADQRLDRSLLGRRVRSPLIRDAVFELELGLHELPYLADHRVHALTIVPAAVFIEMALAAGAELLGETAAVRDFGVEEPLVLSENRPRLVQIVLAAADGGHRFEISTTGADESEPAAWTRHAVGTLRRRDAGMPEDVALAQLEARCGEELPVARYYERLSAIGLSLGARFQAIRQIRRGTREAIVHVQLPDALARLRPGYTCHPVVLDACISAIGAALPQQGSDMHLLTAIGDLRLFGRIGDRIAAHATVEDGAAGSIRSRITLFDETGRIVGSIDGIEVRRATVEALSRAASDVVDWGYDLVWEEKPRPGDGAGLVGPAAIAQAAAAEASRICGDPSIAAVGQWLPRLEAACTAYVVHALRSCGWRPAPGQRIEADVLAAELRIASGHRRLFGRMLRMLEEDGVLAPRGGERYDVVRVPEERDPASLAESVEREVPSAAIELSLVRRCGSRLADVLRGDADPLELLFPGGSLEPLERLYQESPVARAYQELTREAVAAAVRDVPKGRRISVLEIGAGTGATTASVLPVLDPANTRYVFTDMSALFADRAAEKFRSFPFVEYRNFDVERDPALQGLNAGEFDLVIAANVLHATRDLSETLRRVRGLLAPGGVALITEAVRPHRWLDITFGLTDGWWRFEDTALRPAHALVSCDRWLSLVAETGFSDASHMLAPDALAGPMGAQTLLLARAPLREKIAADAVADAAAGRWLILADTGGVGGALADRVRRAGGVPTLVPAAAREQGAFSAARFERLLRELDTPPQRVVYLWGLDASLDRPASPGVVDSFADSTCAAPAHLVQALRASGGQAPLWIATRRSQAAGTNDGVVHPEQTPLWGFARVVALEYPELWGGLIDLDDTTAAEAAAALFEEIVTPDGEDQIAIRGRSRLVARLAGLDRRAWGRPAQLRADASYVVTGGLGSIGLRVARALAEQGARHLVLVGRRGLAGDADPRAEAVREIEALGASVRVVAADVADTGDMERLFRQFGTVAPRLGGVVHAAAALSSAALAELGRAQVMEMLRSKAIGAWVLHQVTAGVDLDFFVLFSSTTGLVGSKNLAHYAAANTFLDGLAHYRRSAGLPAIAINWGVWEHMRSESEADRRLVEHSGLRPMASHRALNALSCLLLSGRAQAVVADVDWSVLIPVYEARRSRPLFERLRGSDKGKKAAAAAGEPTLAERLRQAKPRDRRDVLLAHVRGEAARVLGQDPSRLDVRQGLFDLGLDSLMSVELKSRLERSVDRKLPTTLTFNYPSVEAITDFLMRELPGLKEEEPAQQRPAPAADVRPQPEPAAVLDDLSEDELAARLAEKLAGIGAGAGSRGDGKDR